MKKSDIKNFDEFLNEKGKYVLKGENDDDIVVVDNDDYKITISVGGDEDIDEEQVIRDIKKALKKHISKKKD